ncbi:39S ribosomal protein L15, mitochondrial-like [Mya arenaria]|uniref:39S ribosomal protein L15, mitochondrial-like n=1 Tax=Mya arenaria TaxID=6604 RepID=UPI0022E1638E|nr:39S ribosomal protein L15, mitochondrial-like [Mya arenaria]
MASKIPEKALHLIINAPRVTLNSIKPLPDSYTLKVRQRRSRAKGGQSGRGNKGQGQRMTLPRLGFEGNNTPFYMQMPIEPYYQNHHLRREYPPLSLHTLQRMIDLGRLNTEEPIDLNTICNTGIYKIKPNDNEYGINLTDEGADLFTSRVNVEVQWAEESTIAAIERNGGMITTRFYNPECLKAVIDTQDHFRKGLPIPRCPLPPQDALEYYMNPENRGYLADPSKLQEARYALAQKYGYEAPDYSMDRNPALFKKMKDPRQIFFGLSPGWVVCLKDKAIIKPKDEDYIQYYQS